jgi:protein-tyrosine phosphatase
LSITGLVDIHSHLLHGTDDGCRTLEESLACVRTLMDHGFTGTVCTPHMARDARDTRLSGEYSREDCREGECAAGATSRMWIGISSLVRDELRIAEDTLVWLREFGVPALGASRHMLIDYWGTEWPAHADPIIDHLLEEGYRPILAHPEPSKATTSTRLSMRRTPSTCFKASCNSCFK